MTSNHSPKNGAGNAPEKVELVRVEATVNDPMGIITVDGIIWRDELWLSPYWLDTRIGGLTKPKRIIGVGHLPMQRVPSHDGMRHFLLDAPLPNGLLDDPPTLETRELFQVIERPPIAVQILS